MQAERLRVYLVIFVALVGAVFLGSSIATGDFIWVLAAAGLVALFLLLLGPTEYVWTLLILGVVADFRPNFLQFNISFAEIGTLVLFGNLIIRRRILEQKPLKVGA